MAWMSLIGQRQIYRKCAFVGNVMEMYWTGNPAVTVRLDQLVNPSCCKRSQFYERQTRKIIVEEIYRRGRRDRVDATA